MRNATIDVAVSILQGSDGRVLMAERTPRQISAGFWELPGGKVDPGETPQQAAVRELAEEVDVDAQAVRPWIRYEYAYPTRRIRLFFFRIERWTGVPRGREGQRLAWVDPAKPEVAPVLPSIERVLTALGMPTLLAVSDAARQGGQEGFFKHLRTALQRGVRLVQIREPAMAPDQRVHLAKRVAAVAQRFGARVLLTGTALEARRAGLDALHSSTNDLLRLTSRPPVKLWMASCRDAADLRHAEILGADAAVISPVLASAEPADRPALGWAGFRALAASATIPLYAQGGLSPSLLPLARSAGAAGIATTDWFEQP